MKVIRMKCSKAKEIIASEQDRVFPDSVIHALEEHIHTCEECALYRLKFRDLDYLLDVDSKQVDEAAILSYSFDARLRTSLEREQARRAAAPVVWIDKLYVKLLAAPANTKVRVARTILAALCLVAIVLSTTSVVSKPPAHTEIQCHFGHLASFSAQKLPDGRVCAALTNRESVARSGWKEVHEK